MPATHPNIMIDSKRDMNNLKNLEGSHLYGVMHHLIYFCFSKPFTENSNLNQHSPEYIFVLKCTKHVFTLRTCFRMIIRFPLVSERKRYRILVKY